MRIIYLDSSRLPTEKAHGYQIMKMCEAMAALGHEVMLLAARRESSVAEDPFQYYGMKRIFQIKRLPTVNFVNVVPRFGTWLLRICFLLFAKIYLAFQKYDLLYMREHMSGLFFRNFVLEAHSLPQEIRPADLRVWRRAKKIVVLTSYVKEELVRAGVPAEKILVAPDAVDLGVFDLAIAKEEARKKLGLPEDKVILGYTGSFRTLQMDKGIAVIIKALPPVSKEYPNCLFVAVGGTAADISHYQSLAKASGVEKQVLLLPRARLDKLAIYQKAFDVLLMPFPRQPHYEYYMSPLKMFEYMASDRPIVASRLLSISEILNDGNAVLVEPDSPEALADGILSVINDKGRGASLAAKAREDVRFHTWHNRAKLILQ